MKSPKDALAVLKTAPPEIRQAVVFILRHVAVDEGCSYFGPQRVMLWAADEIEGIAPNIGEAAAPLPF